MMKLASTTLMMDSRIATIAIWPNMKGLEVVVGLEAEQEEGFKEVSQQVEVPDEVDFNSNMIYQLALSSKLTQVMLLETHAWQCHNNTHLREAKHL